MLFAHASPLHPYHGLSAAMLVCLLLFLRAPAATDSISSTSEIA
jgi:hypothetical protein